MATISQWLSRNFPSTYEFVRNFFQALNNKPGGHSLRKWMAIGFFWLVSTLCIEYTDANNLVTVITVLCSMITSLIITYTVGNYHEQKLTKTPNTPPTNGNTDESGGQ